MEVKFFWRANCPNCYKAKLICDELQKLGINVKYFDLDDVEGRAEGAFYEVLSTPSIIIVNKKEKEIISWRGEVPEKEKILKLCGRSSNSLT